MNTYEIIFNRDIAIAQSVRQVQAQSVINKLVTEFATKANSDGKDTANSRLDSLDRFEIPALNLRAQLEEGRKINGLWYERPSMTHYIGLNKDSLGTTVDYLIYTDKSWQAIPNPEQIEEGMDVNFYYHNGQTSLFEVSEKKVLPLDRSLIVSKSENRQILLIIEDPRSQVYYGYSLVLKK